MSDQPFRERRIPPEEVQRVVQLGARGGILRHDGDVRGSRHREGGGRVQSIGAPIVLGAGALFALATAVGSYVGLRRSLARRWEVRSRFADEVVFSVTRAVEESLALRAPKTRVDASTAQAEVDEAAEMVEVAEEVARVERRS